MVKVVYVEHEGVRHEVDLPEGWSAMDGAVQHDIKGIIASCGGAGVCGTCHVYVDQAYLSLLPKASTEELETLEAAAATECLPNSRLACMISLRSETTGIILYLPERQL